MIPAHVLLAGIEALPTLPEAVARLGALLKDESATAADVERVVRTDPAIIAHLLRAANSAFDRGLAPVTTVRDAASRIGLQRVFQVAIGSSFHRILPARIPGHGLDASAFWLHCAAVAFFAEALEGEVRLREWDIAFTAGVLHDVGKLVIGTFLAEEAPESNWWTFGTFQGERALLGDDHGAVGEKIAKHRHLPPPIGQVCRWHHEAGKTVEGMGANLAAMAHVADVLAYLAGFGGGACDVDAIDSTAQNRLRIAPERLSQIVEGLRNEILRMSEIVVAQ